MIKHVDRKEKTDHIFDYLPSINHTLLLKLRTKENIIQINRPKSKFNKLPNFRSGAQ